MPDIQYSRHILAEVRNPTGPAAMNTLLAVGDVNGDGYPDVVTCGRHGRMAWLENPGVAEPSGGWTVHVIDEPGRMECGGQCWPLQGHPGFADVINGNEASADGIYWWANPRGAGRWPRHLIARTGHGQIHDTLVATTGDGRPRLFFTNQGGEGGGRLWTVPIPEDPGVSPWPGLELIADNLWEPNPHKPEWRPDLRQPAEGLAAGDLDGDGADEVVCGCHWFRQGAGGVWEAHRFTEGYVTTKCLVADIDGDGRDEIVLSEGDAVIYGFPRGCRCAWFKPEPGDLTGRWREHVVRDDMVDAHTLQAGPITAPGQVDLLLGEIGQGDLETNTYTGRPPRLWVMVNDGRGNFTPRLIDEGTGVHDSALVDLRRTGRLDIVGKPLHGPHKWNILAWFHEGSTS